MSLALLSPNRTVLLVSDEALYIYSVTSKTVIFIDSVPWDADGFVETVSKIVTGRCEKKPILILNDMVEQHYRKEKVVKAKGSSLDKSSIVKRKLNSAFPNYPVKAAHQLKEKVKAAPGQLGADIYIFAALPDSDQYKKTLTAANKSLASLSGLCLLPIEASDMIKTLGEKLSKSKKNLPKWSVFIGQHKNGGLRQIVTKNGELALTRMTPIVESDTDPEKWADEVYQEFQATISYLSRFDYKQDDAIALNVIANTEAGARLHLKLSEAAEKNSDISINIMTVSEAAKTLNLKIPPQEDERYADILHVAWVGKKTKLILPMKATEVDKVSQPRQIALAASVILACSSAFFVYETFTQFQKLSSLNNDIESTKKRKVQFEAEYQKELERKTKLGFDVRLVQSSMEVYDELEAKKIEPIGFLKDIGNTLGQDMRVDQLSIKRVQQNRNIRRRVSNLISDEEPKDPLFETVLKMVYPSTTDIQLGNQEVQSLAESFSQSLPGYEVSVRKLLKDFEFTEGLIIEAGQDISNNLTQDFVAEIAIEGPFEQEDETQ